MNEFCKGIDCARCLNPYCPIINKERSEQTLKDLQDEKEKGE